MSTYVEAGQLIGKGKRAARPETSVYPRELPRDATLALRPGPGGLHLRSHRGTLLVTQAGDALDHVLEPGDEVVLAARGLVVVWALSDAALTAEARGRPAALRSPRTAPAGG